MKRLLVIHPGTIQEQVLLLPNLEALSSSQIDMVVPPQAQGLFTLYPSIRQVLTFDLESSQGLADWSNLYGMAREREYDAALTTSTSLPIRFLLWLLGIKTRIGATGGPGEFLLTHAVPVQDHLHKTQMYRDLFTVIRSKSSRQHALSIPEKADDWSHATLKKLGITHQSPPLILYDEWNGPPHTSYPLDSWCSVIRGIRDRYLDLPIVLLSTPENQSWIGQMQEQMLGITVLIAKSIEQTTAILQHAQILISSHTAPLYLALEADCPIIGLFGAHKPEQYLSDGAIGLRASSGNLADIAPIQVIEGVSQLLRSPLRDAQSSDQVLNQHSIPPQAYEAED